MLAHYTEWYRLIHITHYILSLLFGTRKRHYTRGYIHFIFKKSFTQIINITSNDIIYIYIILLFSTHIFTITPDDIIYIYIILLSFTHIITITPDDIEYIYITLLFFTHIITITPDDIIHIYIILLFFAHVFTITPVLYNIYIIL